MSGGRRTRRSSRWTEVWVTVRGEDYVAVLDGQTFEERRRGSRCPPDPACRSSRLGTYGYVCSSFTPQTVVISVAHYETVGRVKQESPFCPNIAATPDGSQVWFTTQVFAARPPFEFLKTLDAGPITKHFNRP
jgi:hypothetical protein